MYVLISLMSDGGVNVHSVSPGPLSAFGVCRGGS